MTTTEELIIRTIYFGAQLIAIYINYRIAKHLIKFGINYFFEKKYSFHEYKEIRTEINEIAKDLEKHQEEENR